MRVLLSGWHPHLKEQFSIKDHDGDVTKGPQCACSVTYQFTTNCIIFCFKIGWVKTQPTNPISVLYLILRTTNLLCTLQTPTITLSSPDLLLVIGFHSKYLTSFFFFFTLVKLVDE